MPVWLPCTVPMLLKVENNVVSAVYVLYDIYAMSAEWYMDKPQRNKPQSGQTLEWTNLRGDSQQSGKTLETYKPQKETIPSMDKPYSEKIIREDKAKCGQTLDGDKAQKETNHIMDKP